MRHGSQCGRPWTLFLTGNQIAALVTHFKLSKLAELGTMPPSPIVIRTEVTTSLITRIARLFGEVKHVHGIGIRLRNALLAERTADDFEYFEWLYGYKG